MFDIGLNDCIADPSTRPSWDELKLKADLESLKLNLFG